MIFQLLILCGHFTIDDNACKLSIIETKLSFLVIWTHRPIVCTVKFSGVVLRGLRDLHPPCLFKCREEWIRNDQETFYAGKIWKIRATSQEEKPKKWWHWLLCMCTLDICCVCVCVVMVLQKVWSLTRFYSVSLLQSRIIVLKSVFITNIQTKFASVVF